MNILRIAMAYVMSMFQGDRENDDLIRKAEKWVPSADGYRVLTLRGEYDKERGLPRLKCVIKNSAGEIVGRGFGGTEKLAILAAKIDAVLNERGLTK